MAEVPESRSINDTDIDHATPTASVDINPGDVVVSSRIGDPRSLQVINKTAGRIRPITAAFWGQWSLGVASGKFNNDGLIVNSTTYATPTSQNDVKVYRRGVHRLALTNTAGQKGDYVRYSSGASGSQLFVIDNSRPGWAIGRVYQTFTGATANDPQQVELLVKNPDGQDLYYFLENRVVEGCRVFAAAQPASRVRVGHVQGTVSARNIRIIQNRVYSGAATSIAFGGVCSLTSSFMRFKWVVARSGGFAVRSCTIKKKGGTSYTNAAAISIGMLRPITWTAGEVPVALLLQRSTTNQSNARIFNVRGPAMIPRVGSWGL